MARQESYMWLEEIPGEGATLSILKDQITFWINYFGIEDYYTA